MEVSALLVSLISSFLLAKRGEPPNSSFPNSSSEVNDRSEEKVMPEAKTANSSSLFRKSSLDAMSSFSTEKWGERRGGVVGLRISNSWEDVDGALSPKVGRYTSEMPPNRIEFVVEGGDDNDGAAAAGGEDGIMIFFFIEGRV